MIKIADHTIRLLSADGTINSFDPEWLHRGIVNAFRFAHVQDEWLAEDIALAVEYALRYNDRADNLFPNRN